ncbi:HI0074 family nucleotidyltransferase substrate-binding subunit [Methanobrevibacter filiformis]|uniref:Nucleotidyltransferase substrate binding protein like protein n=1 Tax=Methanobrevibacter filiformis TaxID=55758 RepID=A0A166C7W7_9EURY|nr:HI0074 family nucleotidyltransferase substrate-binding subunit [Methanobrevibacter filiformis]KZX14222.1 nucleotidyltransferase substrate binding protein like protein [Methanobrevibacter filiformis]
MEEKLDITHLKKAYDAYSNALSLSSKAESNPSEQFYIKETIRTSLIHHFETLYELSWKAIKRFVELDEGHEDNLTRRGLFRQAGEKGLIDDFHKWMEFHKSRNLTSHTYNEKTAEKVYVTAKEFDKYAEKLILTLEKQIKEL